MLTYIPSVSEADEVKSLLPGIGSSCRAGGMDFLVERGRLARWQEATHS